MPQGWSSLLSPGLRGHGGRHGRGWRLLGARPEHSGEHGARGEPRQQRGRDAEGARQQRHRGDADPLQLRLLQPLGLGAPVLEPDLHLKKISSLVMWFYNNPITPSLKVNLDTYLFSSCCIFRLILPTPSLHREDKQWAVTRLGTIVTSVPPPSGQQQGAIFLQESWYKLTCGKKCVLGAKFTVNFGYWQLTVWESKDCF